MANVNRPATIKPFVLEEKKEGAKQSVSEISVNKWIGCLLANIKKDEAWRPLAVADITWQQKRVANRGQEAATAQNIDAMLEYISQYAPNCLYRDITLRCLSLEGVWTLVRKWAGIKIVGCHQQRYL